MDKPPLIELKEIKKSFKSKEGVVEVLKGIDLKVYPGERIGIIGPSGVGKTTLLNIVGALEPPTKGEVWFKGKKIDWEKEEQLNHIRKKEVGFVFQLHYLIFELTVLENVMLPGLINRMEKKECKKRAEELLEFLGLYEKRNQTPEVLSGGERQKVAIARALFLKPPLILADEPTGNLDPESAREVVDEFLRLSQSVGSTIMMVTHNIELAKKMKKIFLLKNGFLVEWKS